MCWNAKKRKTIVKQNQILKCSFNGKINTCMLDNSIANKTFDFN